jgi:phosphate transport system substrate-binding protein
MTDHRLCAWLTVGGNRLGRAGRRGVMAIAALSGAMGVVGFQATEAGALGTAISGTGSSFAAPAMLTWINTVSNSPYNLPISYTSSNSGQGRYEFTNQTTDFAVSDIGYVGNVDTMPPSFPFNFIPLVGAGIAFMYNVPGLTKQLQLSSLTACEILTGTITNWDNHDIATENPGVTLPNLAIVPVTESDSAGTNYALESWCIHEQPTVWDAFVQQQETQSGGPTDGVALSDTSPNTNWPGIHGGLDVQSTATVAAEVATNAGAIGAVQTKYAIDEGFSGTNPTKSVALVKNASGDYTAPTPVDVASALAYATQLPNGTAELDFDGVGPHVYNPSTYSYLLTPTTGWSSSKGATMSAFVNYALTLGQEVAPSFGYASLGLALERYGINAVTENVPGAVPLTAAEQVAFACGDLTPSEVAAGQTTPSCGTLQISPSMSSVESGTAQTYVAMGTDQNGNSLGNLTSSTTFTIAPDPGGTGSATGASCSAASCSAVIPGQYMVTGTDGSLSATARLTVLPIPTALSTTSVGIVRSLLGLSTSFSATLRTLPNKAPLAGQVIAFSIGKSVECTGITNGAGVATCRASVLSALSALLAGSTGATFGGTIVYTSSAATAPVTLV